MNSLRARIAERELQRRAAYKPPNILAEPPILAAISSMDGLTPPMARMDRVQAMAAVASKIIISKTVP